MFNYILQEGPKAKISNFSSIILDQNIRHFNIPMNNMFPLKINQPLILINKKVTLINIINQMLMRDEIIY